MNKYKFTYYLNTATAERRPTTKEDIENDWKEEEQEFNSDLEAFEYVYTDILDEYEADLDEFYNDYEATTDTDKIEAFKSYFDSCDVGDGSTIIVQIKRDNEIIYDSGFSKEDLIDEEEYDEEEFDESLSLMEVTMKKLSEDLEESLEVNYLENISKETAERVATSEARICYQTRNGFDIFLKKMQNKRGYEDKFNEDELKTIWNNYLQSEIDEIEKFKV